MQFGRKSEKLDHQLKLHLESLQAYLRNVLGRIADHPINRIDKLLPWHLDQSSCSSSVSV